MGWDFSTEPEFAQELDWMAEFVREEIWPIETVSNELDQAMLDRIYAPLQQRVKERGLWAAHLDPELGGQGFGQVKLGLMHEILGSSPFAPNAFGCQAPDSGNSEILALAGTTEQKERWLYPLLEGDLRSAFSMTEPHTAGSDPTQLANWTRDASTTACAGSASRGAPSTCFASAPRTAGARQGARRTPNGSELDRRLGGADAGRA